MDDSNTPESSPDAPASPHRRVDAFVALVAFAAIGATLLTFELERVAHHEPVNLYMFAGFAALLFFSENASSTWLKMTTGGVVTLSWTFAFSLLLIGSPIGAIAAMAFTTLVGEIRAGNDFRRITFNIAQVSLALAAGGLTFMAFGLQGPITSAGTISISTGLAILVSGVVVFATNGVIVCFLLSIVHEVGFMRLMRDEFAISMTADGALLALAPIFVVSVEFSLMMVPLIVIAAYLVYRSARAALERAHEANHDTLTELRNRRAFVAELNRYLSERQPSETADVLLIDLDGFKAINDRLGHQVGDDVLRIFGGRLIEALPANAVVARLGGDEFAALIPRRDDCADGAAYLAVVHQQLVEPMTIDGFALSVGASIGVSKCPEHGESSTALLHAADIAMYRAKQFGTGVEHHEVNPHGRRDRRDLLTALADAVGTTQLGVAYRPIVHLRDRSIVAVEALVRWRHPTLGEISSEEFVSLADQTDLIGPIMDFVIERAVRDVTSVGSETMRLVINMPTRCMSDGRFANKTLATLDRLGFDPVRLELDVTEETLAADPERVRVTLSEFRSAGVGLAIAEFGRSRSSYETLRRLRVDRLKIDRSFTSDLCRRREDHVIVQSMIDLGHGLGLEVVAHAADDDDVTRELATMGCDAAQCTGAAEARDFHDIADLARTAPSHGERTPAR